MADTIRSRTALLALLADNTNGDISAQDMRDVLVSVHGVYGAIYAENGSTAQTGISDTAAKMTGFSANGISSGTTPDYTNNQITLGSDGIYLVFLQVSFTGTASKTFECQIRNNDGNTNYHSNRKLGATGDVGSASCLALLSCSANDVMSVYVLSSDGGSSFTINEAQLVVYRIA